MKLWMVILIPMYLCTTIPAHADGVFLEGGGDFFSSDESQVMFLSYQIDTPSVFGLDTFCKGALGFWNGPNRSEAIVLAMGILWNLPGESYICFEPGGAYITETTDNLGTHLQFALRFALGMRLDKIDLSVGYKHFSNGNAIFNWSDTPNYGENFITLQIGYLW
jgi:hypothetical protein